MAAQRRIPQYVANLKQGAWQQSGLKTSAMPPNFGLGQVLRGQTLGIWGYGKIGRLVAGYGKAFGMNVLIWGREHSLEAARADGYTAAESREALFEQSDVLSLHLRLHDDTRGIVKQEDLMRMKPTSLLVNTSRAELLEENALVNALSHNRPGMVAIDVFESEPILQGYSLLRMENVICTPHIGYVERESYGSTSARHSGTSWRSTRRHVERRQPGSTDAAPRALSAAGRACRAAPLPASRLQAATRPPVIAPTRVRKCSPSRRPRSYACRICDGAV